MEKTDIYNLNQRKEYIDCIEELIKNRAGEKSKQCCINYLNGTKEELRKKYINILGWPLTERNKIESGTIKARTEKLPDFNGMICTRYQLEVIPDFWFYGILYEPIKKTAKGLVIALH